MLADRPPSPVAGDAHSPTSLRIHAEGVIEDSLLSELGALSCRRVPGGAVLVGQVSDAAELWGVLHRLQRAGALLRSFERLGSPCRKPTASGTAGSDEGAESGQGREVCIEVDGDAAGVIAVVVGEADVYQTPPSTTLVLRMEDDRALYGVLDQLEDLALDLRGVHVGP